ncbi:hypothetical protein AAMO2058_000494600 [Amorphochlora amoebiformis]
MASDAKFIILRVGAAAVGLVSAYLVYRITRYSPKRVFLSSTGTPLPQHPHRSLRLNQIHKQLLIVGDIHGCLAETKELFRAANFNPKTTTAISVGDLVNKGPASHGVVQYLRTTGAMAVRGNHDDACLQASLRIGRYEKTVPEKYQYVDHLTQKDKQWLSNIPLTIRIPQLKPPILVVHAGVVPGVPLLDQQFEDMVMMRELEQSNGRWNAVVQRSDDSILWAKVFSKGGSDAAIIPEGKESVHVFFGHDAKQGLQQESLATGLDTGCCYGKSLTGALVTINDDATWTQRLISVPAHEIYTAPRDNSVVPPVTAPPKL